MPETDFTMAGQDDGSFYFVICGENAELQH